MPSRRETALSALFTALTHVPGATVERESAIPERVAPGGLVILRDDDPGTPEVTLSPLLYHYEHAARVEALVQAPQAATRALALDGLLRAVGEALAADRTLGGTCEWLAWEAPAVDELPVAGGAAIKAATIVVVLSYSTADPLS